MATGYNKSNDYNKPVIDFQTLDLFTLWAPALSRESKRPMWSFCFPRGNPRFYIYTRNDSAPRKGVLEIAMNPFVFYSILQLLENLATGKAQQNKYLIETDRMDYDAAEKRRILGSVLEIGKNEDGMIYMMATAEGYPRIPFMFDISDWHRFRKGDGTPFSEKEASCLQCQAFVASLREVAARFVGVTRNEIELAGRDAESSKPTPAPAANTTPRQDTRKPRSLIDDDYV